MNDEAAMNGLFACSVGGCEAAYDCTAVFDWSQAAVWNLRCGAESSGCRAAWMGGGQRNDGIWRGKKKGKTEEREATGLMSEDERD